MSYELVECVVGNLCEISADYELEPVEPVKSVQADSGQVQDGIVLSFPKANVACAKRDETSLNNGTSENGATGEQEILSESSSNVQPSFGYELITGLIAPVNMSRHGVSFSSFVADVSAVVLVLSILNPLVSSAMAASFLAATRFPAIYKASLAAVDKVATIWSTVAGIGELTYYRDENAPLLDNVLGWGLVAAGGLGAFRNISIVRSGGESSSSWNWPVDLVPVSSFSSRINLKAARGNSPSDKKHIYLMDEIEKFIRGSDKTTTYGRATRRKIVEGAIEMARSKSRKYITKMKIAIKVGVSSGAFEYHFTFGELVDAISSVLTKSERAKFGRRKGYQAPMFNRTIRGYSPRPYLFSPSNLQQEISAGGFDSIRGPQVRGQLIYKAIELAANPEIYFINRTVLSKESGISLKRFNTYYSMKKLVRLMKIELPPEQYIKFTRDASTLRRVKEVIARSRVTSLSLEEITSRTGLRPSIIGNLFSRYPQFLYFVSKTGVVSFGMNPELRKEAVNILLPRISNWNDYYREEVSRLFSQAYLSEHRASYSKLSMISKKQSEILRTQIQTLERVGFLTGKERDFYLLDHLNVTKIKSETANDFQAAHLLFVRMDDVRARIRDPYSCLTANKKKLFDEYAPYLFRRADYLAAHKKYQIIKYSIVGMLKEGKLTGMTALDVKQATRFFDER